MENNGCNLDLNASLSSFEDCSHRVLENGLTYFVMKNNQPKGSCELRLSVKVGSVHEEGEEEVGLAHLVEHLVFRCAGESKRSYETVRLLESLGISFGGCLNGETKFEETTYSLTVPLGQDLPANQELIAKSLQVMSRWAFDAKFGAADIEAEKEVICDEWRHGQSAERRGQTAHLCSLFSDSKFARSRPMCDPALMRKVSTWTAQKFYRRWYCPSRMAMVVVGDFDNSEAMEGLIQKYFGRGLAGKEIQNPELGNPLHVEEPVVIYEDDEETATKLSVTCKRIPKPLVTVRDFRNQLAEALAHFCLVQRMKKYSFNISDAEFWNPHSDTQLLSANVECVSFKITTARGSGPVLSGLRTLVSLLAEVKERGFAEAEVLAAIGHFVEIFKEEGLGGRKEIEASDMAAVFVEHFHFNEPVLTASRRVALGLPLLTLITPAEVSAKASCYSETKDWFTFVSRPRQAPDDLHACALDLLESQSVPWCSLPSLPCFSGSTALEEPVAHGSVVERRQLGDVNETELLLSNGIRIFLRNSAGNDPFLHFKAEARGGFSQLPLQSWVNGRLANIVVSRLTWFGLPPEAVADLFSGEDLELSAEILPFSREVKGKGPSGKLSLILNLIRLLFSSPTTKSLTSIRAHIQRLQDSIYQQARDPRVAFQNAVVTAITSASPLHCPLTCDDLRRADPQMIAGFFDECFCDPSQFTFAFSGAIDLDLAVPLISRYLGAIQSPRRDFCKGLEEDRNHGLTSFSSPSTENHLRMRMTTPVVFAEVAYSIPFGSAILEHLEQLCTADLLCEILRARLTERLRFNLGGVYGVFVTCNSIPGPFGPSAGILAVSFSCNPKEGHLERLLCEISEVISGLRETFIPTEVLSVSVAQQLRKFRQERERNLFWVDLMLCANKRRDQGRSAQETFQAMVDRASDSLANLTPALLRGLFQSCLSESCGKKVTVTLSPLPSTRNQQVRAARGSAEKEEEEEILSSEVER